MKTNIEEVILFQIEQTTKAAKRYTQKEFDRLKLGITVDQWIILKIISENDGLTQKELADKSLRDPAAITRSIDLLEKKGFVIRQAIPEDRRGYQIILSGTGAQFVADQMPLIQLHRTLSTNGLTKKELSVLSATLEKIRNNMT